jgi:hypothetical protein
MVVTIANNNKSLQLSLFYIYVTRFEAWPYYLININLNV